MTRGRKAQPEAVADAKGNPGKRPVARAPEDLAPIGGTAPAELTDADARRIWGELAPSLGRMKFLRTTDHHAFARYCQHLSRWWALTRDIENEGETYVTESAHGVMRRINPKFIARDRIEGQLERLEDRFGLTPASRQTLLQRLALAPAAALPPSDLFGGQPQAAAPVDGSETPPPPQPAVSPIGLLAARNRLN